MMARRALALLAAAVMVVGAFVIRQQIHGSEDDAGRASGRLACVPELAEVCARVKGVEVVVEPPLTTIRRLVAMAQRDEDVVPVAGWVTFAPWPEVAEIRTGRKDLVPTVDPLAATPLVLAMPQERTAKMAEACGGLVDWRCVVGASGNGWPSLGGQEAWGSVRVGLPPRTSGTGLLFAGAAVRSFFGDLAPEQIATNDFDPTPGFRPYLDKVLSSASPSGDPFQTFVLQFPAAFSAVGALGANWAERAGTRVEAIEAFTPDEVRAVAVVAWTGPRGEVQGLRDALGAQGWSGADATTTSGLPSAGVLAHLLDR